MSCRIGAAQLANPGERLSIDREQSVSLMNSQARGFTSHQRHAVASGIDRKEGGVDLLAMEKVGNIAELVEQSDRKKNGQQAIEEDGSLDGHGMSFS